MENRGRQSDKRGQKNRRVESMSIARESSKVILKRIKLEIELYAITWAIEENEKRDKVTRKRGRKS